MAPTLSGTEDEVYPAVQYHNTDRAPLFISVPMVLHVIGMLLFRVSILSKSMRKTRGRSDEGTTTVQAFRPGWLGNSEPQLETYD